MRAQPARNPAIVASSGPLLPMIREQLRNADGADHRRGDAAGRGHRSQPVAPVLTDLPHHRGRATTARPRTTKAITCRRPVGRNTSVIANAATIRASHTCTC